MTTIRVSAELDVAEQVLYENIVKFLPSIPDPAVRAQKAKELGQEPLCQENVDERLFKLGIRAFLQQFEESGENVYSAVVKNKVLSAYTNVARTLVDLHTGFQSRMKATEEKHGKDSEQYRIADAQYSAICMAIALVDRDFLGGDTAEGLVPKGKEKPVKKQRRKKK